jgi:hypothetical protein
MIQLALAILAVTVQSAQAQPSPDAVWESMQTKPVVIECTAVAGVPWCRSTGLVGAPLDKVAASLENMDQSADVFEAVSSIRKLEADTFHITMDYPGLMSDRDYVAKYVRTEGEGGSRTYAWQAVVHAAAPQVAGVVRLVRMAGHWHLVPKGNATTVTYLWQADVGGSFPNWALPLARKKTGNEALKDISKAPGASLSPP